jgi:hypothetical protein
MPKADQHHQLNRALFSRFVAKHPLNDEEDIGRLQRQIAIEFGYVLVDWARRAWREIEYTVVDVHKDYCYAHKQALIVLFFNRRSCALQIDADPMQRPMDVCAGGLTGAEQDAIDALVRECNGRRVWGDSPVLRRYEGIPYERAHTAARSAFQIIMGEVA